MVRKVVSDVFFWVLMISMTVFAGYFATVATVNTFHREVVPCQIDSARYAESSGAGTINRFVVIECEGGQQFTTSKLPAEYRTREDFAEALDAHRGDTVEITVGALRYLDGGYHVFGVDGL